MMYLSVIIPTFNRVGFLQQMLQSVLQQIVASDLYNEVEIVISDNCSSDDTAGYVQELKQACPLVQITYNRNETNIGAVRNMLRLIELSKGMFCMFYGDDDRMCDGALPQIVEIIRAQRDLAVFVFKQKGFPEITKTETLSIHDCAAHYFNYMGNACSAWRTSFAQRNIKQYYQSLTSTCWPQTHLMYLGMYDAGLPKPVLVSNLEVYEEQPKDNNNIPNSFYIYDSMFYSLLRLGKIISEQKQDPAFYRAIGNGIFTLRKSKYIGFCRYLIHTNKVYCTRKEKQDFGTTLQESLNTIKGRYKLYTLPIVLLNMVPSKLYQWLYLNGKSLYKYFRDKNGTSLQEAYSQSKQRLRSLQEERFKNMQKKHAIIINKGDW